MPTVTVLRGRRPTLELALDHVHGEAARLGLRVVRTVAHTAPDRHVEFVAALEPDTCPRCGHVTVLWRVGLCQVCVSRDHFARRAK